MFGGGGEGGGRGVFVLLLLLFSFRENLKSKNHYTYMLKFTVI